MVKRGDKHGDSHPSGSQSGGRPGVPRRKSLFQGISVVPGIAIGPVILKFRETQVLSDQPIGKGEVEREYERLAEAVRLSKSQLL